MSDWVQPSAEQQLEFLQNLQRLFEEGDFTATYKYALLMAFAEIAVESGDDSGAPLPIEISGIAEKFVEFYWRQSAPYTSGMPGAIPGILSQNLGKQAAIVNRLERLRATEPSLVAARHSQGWRANIASIASVVRQMPVRYLQNIGGTAVTFLYDHTPQQGRLILKSGVAFNLRRFHGLVQQLARAGWIEHVRGNARNAGSIGKVDDLDAFMFGGPRANLSAVGAFLRKLQSGRCFYCGGGLHNSAAVDHFIPWSRYPRDTAHNFVLTHANCNGDKRELLAASVHLDGWLRRNEDYGAEIGGHLSELGFVADRECSRTIARWAYAQAMAHQGHAWIARRQTESIDDAYLSLLE